MVFSAAEGIRRRLRPARATCSPGLVSLQEGQLGFCWAGMGGVRGQFYLGFRALARPLNKLARRRNALGIMVEGTGSGKGLGDKGWWLTWLSVR